VSLSACSGGWHSLVKWQTRPRRWPRRPGVVGPRVPRRVHGGVLLRAAPSAPRRGGSPRPWDGWGPRGTCTHSDSSTSCADGLGSAALGVRRPRGGGVWQGRCQIGCRMPVGPCIPAGIQLIKRPRLALTSGPTRWPSHFCARVVSNAHCACAARVRVRGFAQCF
jgi:hypothetical protein